jgi:hypothetical protein
MLGFISLDLHPRVFWQSVHLAISCVAPDQKRRIYLVMTGFRGIVGLCSKMPISTNVLLGQRLVYHQSLQFLLVA